MNAIALLLASLVNAAYISKWSDFQSASPFIRSLRKFFDCFIKIKQKIRMH